jgi:hypothetical protein
MVLRDERISGGDRVVRVKLFADDPGNEVE